MFVTRDRGPMVLPVLWMVCVLALAWHQWTFWRAPRLDADVFALLPQDERVPAAQQAMQQLAQQGERRVVLMVSGASWSQTLEAAHQVEGEIGRDSSGMRSIQSGPQVAQLMSFFAPWRNALLTESQKEALPHADVKAMTDRKSVV